MRAEDRNMLKRTVSPSALAGMTVCLIFFIIFYTMKDSKSGFVAGSVAHPRGSAAGQAGNQKVLAKAAPHVDLTETPINLQDIQNSTLGFQKIFVLSMPNRSDKRDAFALSAYLSGLEVEFIDGVDPATIPQKAYPQNWKFTEDEPAGTLGCWRGHMNVYRKMLDERIQSALVMEDDADWDVMIKAQMTEVARGTRYLQKANASSLSPYGDNWDLLTTGHCGMWNRIDADEEYWVIKDDTTVIPPEKRKFWRKPNLSPPQLAGNHTRLVLSPYHFSCTGSYAISISGAARALFDQAIMPHAESIDMGLGKICRRHEYGFSTCLGTYPMITGVHKQAGSVLKDSDRTVKGNRPDRKYASSDNLMYPVRLNLGNLLKGETIVKAQYPTVLSEIDILTQELPRGYPVLVNKKEYVKGYDSKEETKDDKMKDDKTKDDKTKDDKTKDDKTREALVETPSTGKAPAEEPVHEEVVSEESATELS